MLDAKYPEIKLGESAGKGQLNIVSVLVDAKADVNAYVISFLQHTPHISRATALIVSASAGHAGCVRLLLNAAADVLRKDLNGDTAFIVSAQAGHSNCVKLLLAAGSDVEYSKFN